MSRLWIRATSGLRTAAVRLTVVVNTWEGVLGSVAWVGQGQGLVRLWSCVLGRGGSGWVGTMGRGRQESSGCLAIISPPLLRDRMGLAGVRHGVGDPPPCPLDPCCRSGLSSFSSHWESILRCLDTRQAHWFVGSRGPSWGAQGGGRSTEVGKRNLGSTSRALDSAGVRSVPRTSGAML